MKSVSSRQDVPIWFVVLLFATIVLPILLSAAPVHAQDPVQYQVSFNVNPSGGGSTNPLDTASYNAGSSISISATPASGYGFSGWSVSNSSSIMIADPSSASTSATIDGYGTITANFSPTTVTPADTETVVICSTSSVPVGTGTTCTATVTSSSPLASATVSWSAEGSGIFDSISCTLDGSPAACSVLYTPTDVDSGVHMMVANYVGDAGHLDSSGRFDLTVTGSTSSTTTTTAETTTSSATTTSGQAAIWTDKADYAPGETPTIYGAGFNANANITVTVTRPDGTVNTWSTISDDAGSFTTTYALDGIEGSYAVMATDGTNTATTAFTDKWYTVTVDASSIRVASDVAAGTVVATVEALNSTSSNCYLPTTVKKSDLPFNCDKTGAGGTERFTYSFTSPVSSTTAGKRYRWSSTSGYSQTLQSNTFTIGSTSATLSASYIAQYSVSFAVSPSGGGSITVDGQPSATAWYDGGSVLNIEASPNSGYTFSSWTATGSITFGSTSLASTTATIGGTGTITATFSDTTPPTVSISSPTSGSYVKTATVAVSDSASDSGSGVAKVEVQVDGGAFSLATGTTSWSFTTAALSDGSHSVTAKATDNAGNSATSTSVTFTVDTTAPVLTLPSPAPVAEATSSSGATVIYTATATDAIDGPITPTCTPASGSTFPLGTTSVSCSATDRAGNTGSGTFDVTVVDTTAPVLTLPSPDAVEATGSTGAVVTYTAPSATDLVDGSVPVTCDKNSGDTFELGTTTVSCSATDAATNEGSGTFDVTVVDTTAPVIAAHLDVTAEATSSAGAAVTYTSPAATDNYDASVTVVCAPASGSTFALGDATVTCSAVDAAGNHAISTTFVVHVVYSQSKGRTVLSPLEQVDDPSKLKKSHQTGSTIPIKFQLFDSKGVPIGTAKATLQIFDAKGNAVPVKASGSSNVGNVFRYDPTEQQYIYNLSTKGLSPSVYKIVITLDDGTTIVTYFRLK